MKTHCEIEYQIFVRTPGGILRSVSDVTCVYNGVIQHCTVSHLDFTSFIAFLEDFSDRHGVTVLYHIKDEGITWLHGHLKLDGLEAKALLTAYALTQEHA